MVRRVADALRGAGAEAVLVVGGEPAWAALADASWIPDEWPGEGPLGGIATGLAAASARSGADALVLVAACDQPWLDGAVLAQLVTRLRTVPDATAAAARDGSGRVVAFPAVHRAERAAAVSALVAAGVRRADAALDPDSLLVLDLAADQRRDVDHPGDMSGSP